MDSMRGAFNRHFGGERLGPDQIKADAGSLIKNKTQGMSAGKIFTGLFRGHTAIYKPGAEETSSKDNVVKDINIETFGKIKDVQLFKVSLRERASRWLKGESASKFDVVFTFKGGELSVNVNKKELQSLAQKAVDLHEGVVSSEPVTIEDWAYDQQGVPPDIQHESPPPDEEQPMFLMQSTHEDDEPTQPADLNAPTVAYQGINSGGEWIPDDEKDDDMEIQDSQPPPPHPEPPSVEPSR